MSGSHCLKPRLHALTRVEFAVSALAWVRRYGYSSPSLPGPLSGKGWLGEAQDEPSNLALLKWREADAERCPSG